MPGLINFRDFGGARSIKGAVTRGRLYRSGHLAHLDETDLTIVRKLNFKLVIDLRYVGEQELEPSCWHPVDDASLVCHGKGRSGQVPHMAVPPSEVVTLAHIREIFIETYRKLPFNAIYRPLFAEAFQQLAHSSGRCLIHCTAGKDRTGILVALILHVLGVERREIVREYMISQNDEGLSRMKKDFVEKYFEINNIHLDENSACLFLGVNSEYILEMFDSVEEKCGSVWQYFSESGVKNVHLEAIRQNFVDL